MTLRDLLKAWAYTTIPGTNPPNFVSISLDMQYITNLVGPYLSLDDILDMPISDYPGPLTAPGSVEMPPMFLDQPTASTTPLLSASSSELDFSIEIVNDINSASEYSHLYLDKRNARVVLPIAVTIGPGSTPGT